MFARSQTTHTVESNCAPGVRASICSRQPCCSLRRCCSRRHTTAHNSTQHNTTLHRTAHRHDTQPQAMRRSRDQQPRETIRARESMTKLVLLRRTHVVRNAEGERDTAQQFAHCSTAREGLGRRKRERYS